MNEGVGVVVLDDANRVLLGRRANEPERGEWALIGGRCEDDEFPLEAMRREVLEEVGVSLERQRFLGLGTFAGDQGGTLSHYFSGQCSRPPEVYPLDEHTELAWFSLDKLPAELAKSAQLGISLLKSDDVTETKQVETHGDAAIWLIQPPFPLADKEALSLPLGLASIAAKVEEMGVGVSCFDGSLLHDYNALIALLSTPGEIATTPNLIGIQFHSQMSFDWSVRFCRLLRKYLPNAHLCAGGELATTRSQELLDLGVVDTVVFGQGEDTFAELSQTVLMGDSAQLNCHNIPGTAQRLSSGEVRTNRPRPVSADIDDNPLPAVSKFRWQFYGQWTIMTSRGCPFKCMYCSSAAYWNHKIYFHSPARVFQEIERLHKDFGAQQIYIADDTFTMRKDRVAKICRLLIDSDVRVKWSCLTRFDCVDPDLLELMHAAGCVQISFGLDSTNQDVLAAIERKQDLAKAEMVFKACQEVGIRTRTSVVFGLPYETKQSLLSTADWLAKARPNEIQIYGLTPHDGTALFRSLEALGVRILSDDPIEWSRDILKPICETDHLPAKILVEVASEYVRRFVQLGYVYLNELSGNKKVGAEYTIATSFSPVQGIKSIENFAMTKDDLS